MFEEYDGRVTLHGWTNAIEDGSRVYKNVLTAAAVAQANPIKFSRCKYHPNNFLI